MLRTTSTYYITVALRGGGEENNWQNEEINVTAQLALLFIAETRINIQ